MEDALLVWHALPHIPDIAVVFAVFEPSLVLPMPRRQSSVSQRPRGDRAAAQLATHLVDAAELRKAGPAQMAAGKLAAQSCSMLLEVRGELVFDVIVSFKNCLRLQAMLNNHMAVWRAELLASCQCEAMSNVSLCIQYFIELLCIESEQVTLAAVCNS